MPRSPGSVSQPHQSASHSRRDLPRVEEFAEEHSAADDGFAPPFRPRAARSRSTPRRQPSTSPTYPLEDF